MSFSAKMSARDQVTKMLDQLMGQNRDGEWSDVTLGMYIMMVFIVCVNFKACVLSLSRFDCNVVFGFYLL